MDLELGPRQLRQIENGWRMIALVRPGNLHVAPAERM
jgi:hypothetical protein